MDDLLKKIIKTKEHQVRDKILSNKSFAKYLYWLIVVSRKKTMIDVGHIKAPFGITRQRGHQVLCEFVDLGFLRRKEVSERSIMYIPIKENDVPVYNKYEELVRMKVENSLDNYLDDDTLKNELLRKKSTEKKKEKIKFKVLPFLNFNVPEETKGIEEIKEVETSTPLLNMFSLPKKHIKIIDKLEKIEKLEGISRINKEIYKIKELGHEINIEEVNNAKNFLESKNNAKIDDKVIEDYLRKRYSVTKIKKESD